MYCVFFQSVASSSNISSTFNSEKIGNIYRREIGFGMGENGRQTGTNEAHSEFKFQKFFHHFGGHLFLTISTHSGRGKVRRTLRIDSLVLAARRGSISRYKDRGRDCFCCSFLLRLRRILGEDDKGFWRCTPLKSALTPCIDAVSAFR
ncbi:hypothetical protein AABB24_031485 [Solanum stoloniferum]|uniref:Uncharacterized protein n=1 Tax=Solanum stoloniferum TaxID=62892 RepID=A0ABD2RUP3_9SOLN